MGEVRVLDDTTEFIRNIGLAQKEQAEAAVARRRKRKPQPPAPLLKPPSPPPLMRVESRGKKRATWRWMSWERSTGTGTSRWAKKRRWTKTTRWNSKGSLAADAKPKAEEAEGEGEMGGTGKEKYVSGGLAATLSILKQQGLIKPMTEEEQERERLYQEKVAWQTEQHRQDALRPFAEGNGEEGRWE